MKTNFMVARRINMQIMILIQFITSIHKEKPQFNYLTGSSKCYGYKIVYVCQDKNTLQGR